MTTILDPLEPALNWLLHVSGQAAILVILIVLVQALIREKVTPGWRHALWLLLVLRLALPVQVPSRFSLFNLTQFRPKAPAAEFANPAALQALPAPGVRSEASLGDTASNSASTSPATPFASRAAAASAEPTDLATAAGWRWESSLALLWLAGVAGLVLRILVQNLSFYQRLRWAPTVTDTQAWQTLEHCRELLRVRHRLVLVETAMVHSPAL